jgi:hypothetical protein
MENAGSLFEAYQLAAPVPREFLLDALAMNDPNGTYTDEDSADEGMPPLSHTEALGIVMRVLNEQAWVVDDPRQYPERNPV